MKPLDYVVLGIAAALAVPLICRLAPFDKKVHQWSVGLMYVGMAFAVAGSGYQAYLRQADVGNLLAVLCVATWVAISYRTWSHGVPAGIKKGGTVPGIDLTFTLLTAVCILVDALIRSLR